MAEKTCHSVDALIILIRKWKLISTICFLVALVSGLINFLLLPRWFEATAVLMPPKDKSGFSSIGMLLSRIPNLPGGISSLASGIAGYSQSQNEFVVILNSRTIADSLIDKYDLEKVYKSDYRFEAREELASNTTIDFPPEGHVIIKVEAKEDSVLARDLAYEYYIQLNNVLYDKALYSASNKRKFLEERLAQTSEKLVQLEDSLKNYQEHNKLTAVGERPESILETIIMPVKGDLEVLSMLQAEKEAKAIELQVKKSIYQPRHPDVLMLQREIEEFARTIKKYESQIPALALDFARLYRDVKMQEELFLLLSAQLEETRINEADNTPTAILLDEPVIPEYKCRPKRLLNMAITTGAVFILLAFFLIYDERRRTQNKDTY